MLTFPRVNQPYAGTDARPHAVVIGSGFGGLAAAIRLGARGWRVTVLERLDRLGGRAGVLREEGFTFDRGPTIVTAPFLFEELWTLAGARMRDDIDLRSLSPFYRIRFDDGFEVPCHADDAAMRREVAAFAPADLDGYDRFMAFAREVCRVGFEGLGATPFSRITDMLRIAPQLLRLHGWRSVHAVVSRFVKDKRLRVILSFHPLLIGGNPVRAPAIYCLIPHLERQWGVHYPMGGVNQLVAGLAGLVERQGGSIRLAADVARIETSQGRVSGVTLASGERIDADIVVSNADAMRTYSHLLGRPGGGLPAPLRAKPMRQSMGVFVWYFGVRGHYGTVGHHTILLGPRFEGLLADIFERKRLTADFSVYLHRPSASDPSVAPPGHDAFYVLCPVPNLESGTDWAVEGERRRAAIQKRLEETVLPGLGARIVFSRFTTPADFGSEYLSESGAGFGVEPVLTQSAWFRPHNRSPSVEGLYLVGAGTHPGAGLPGVLSSARALDGLVPDGARHAR